MLDLVDPLLYYVFQTKKNQSCYSAKTNIQQSNYFSLKM
jgi:hypothetical protein